MLQWDERWGYALRHQYRGGERMRANRMAMVAAGLNKDPSITPAKVAAYGTENHVDEDNNAHIGRLCERQEQLEPVLL